MIKRYVALLMVLLMIAEMIPAVASASSGASWTPRTSGTTSDLKGITYGNGQFVAAGVGGTILTSSDGSAWTDKTGDLSYQFNGITYGGGNYVAVGFGGAIITSTDADSWTFRTVGNSEVLNGVAYGNGMYVAVGYSGKIFTSSDGNSWAGQTSGTPNTLYGVTYGGGMFVAVGQSGIILTSTDGVNWISRTSSTGVYLMGVTFGNGTYIAVGEFGTILTSDDSVNWKNLTLDEDNDFFGVSYGNGSYATVTRQGSLLASNDGSSWSSQPSGTSNELTSVAYGNNAIVAVGGGGTVVQIDNPTYALTYNSNGSTEGTAPSSVETYSEGALVTLPGNAGNLAKAGYTFVGWNTEADGSGANYTAGMRLTMGAEPMTLYAKWTSGPAYTVTYDGNGSTGGTPPQIDHAFEPTAWVEVLENRGNLVKAGHLFTGWNTMADGSGTSYAAGATFSLDGANVTLYAQWFLISTYTVSYNDNGSIGGTVPTDSQVYEKNAVVTVAGNSGSLVKPGYLFTGWNTKADGSGISYASGATFNMGDADVQLYAQWAPIPDWTTRTSGTSNDLKNVTYGNGKYVAVGDSGVILTSADGLVWTNQASSTSVQLNDVTYGGDKYVALGNGGTILTSGDAASWTDHSVGGSQALRGIAYGKGMYVAVGDGGKIMTSGDGDNWMIRTSGTDQDLYGVTYNGNGMFVAVGLQGSVLTSGNGADWSSQMSETDNLLAGATLGNGLYAAVGGLGTIVTSSNGADWAGQPSTTSVQLNGISYGNGSYVAAGRDGAILASNDGSSWKGQISGTTQSLNGVAYGDDSIVVVGDGGTILQISNPTYTVTYNGNGSTGGAVPVEGASYSVGAAVTILGNTGSLVKAGHTFVGWNTEADGSGTSYAAGLPFIMGAADVTLYARWTTDFTYTVTYNGNGSTGGTVPAANAFEQGATVTVAGNTGDLAREGQEFTGWNTKADGSGMSYAAGATFTVEGADVTLYAQWSTIPTFIVTYDGNGSEAGAVPADDQKYLKNAVVTVMGNTGALAKAGYRFTGWNTVANGTGTSYAAGATFRMRSSDMTLYAQWALATDWSPRNSGWSYDLKSVMEDNFKFVAVGAFGILTSSDGVAWTVATWSPFYPQFNGFTTGNRGMFVAVGSGGAVLTSLNQGANWTAQTVGDSEDLNSVTWGNGMFVAVGNSGRIFTSTDGSSWVGRTSGTSVDLNGVIYDGDVMFVAVGDDGMILISPDGVTWSRRSTDTEAYLASVTYGRGLYVAVGGTGTILTSTDGDYWTVRRKNGLDNFNSVSYGNGSYVAVGSKGLVVESKDGIIWNSMESGTVTALYGVAHGSGTVIAVGDAGTILQANPWFTVTYNGNGSTGGVVPAEASYPEGIVVTVPENEGNLVKAGHTFTGWNTAANGSGTSYAPGATFKMGAANVTLYAQWASDSTYTVTYNGNGSTGGTVPTESGAYEQNATVTVLGNTGSLVKSGHTFTGWNTAANGSGTSYAPGATFKMGAANVTLYAQWTTNPTYTVTYNGNGSTGGTVPTESGAYEQNATVTVLGNTGSLVKAGHTFTGWNTAANGSGTSYAAGATFKMGAANMTLYAQWTVSSGSDSGGGSGGTGGSGGSGGSGDPAPVPAGEGKVISENGEISLPAGKPGEVSLGATILIEIPANAADKDLKVTIKKLLDTQELLNDKDVLVSPIYEILKNSSGNFEKPVKLTFAFDSKRLTNNQKPSVFYFDEQDQVWVEVGGSISGNKITVEVNHFTKFAVFAIEKEVVSPEDEPVLETKFSDISGHWAEASIKQAVRANLVRGYDDGTFKPGKAVSRAEFAVMLMKALKPQGEAAALNFTDKATIGDWAQESVAQAVHAGVITGYEDGTFRPDAFVTRAEMAVMVAKALKLPIETASATSFADDADIPTWASGAIAAINKIGIINGSADNRFLSSNQATRAEAITVLLKMLEQSN